VPPRGARLRFCRNAISMWLSPFQQREESQIGGPAWN
jgi:hypothetical protein